MATATTSEMPADNAATVLVSTFSLSDLAPPPTTVRLTLTADFPLNSYEAQLAAFTLPAALPASITSLTLELFTYGYPPGFLASLGSLLPRLTEITLYLQLVAGTTAESFHDAKAFLGTALRNGLQKLKLVDVFVPPDFFPAAAAAAAAGEDGTGGAWSLRELTLLYTFRSADREFNERLPAATVPVLLRPGLERLTVRVQPEAADKPGMTPCAGEAGAGVVDALMAWSKADAARLRRLDLSAFAFDAATVARLASRFRAVAEAAWAVCADGRAEGKKSAMQAAAVGKQLQELEVVACPGMEFYGAVSTHPSGEWLDGRCWC